MKENDSKDYKCWIVELAHFLEEQKDVEAVKFDPTQKTLAMATVGVVDEEQLEVALISTIEGLQDQVNSTVKEDLPDAFEVKEEDGVTTVQKRSPKKNLKFWKWRDVEWPEEEHDHGDEWKFFALLAGVCGVLGIIGYVMELMGKSELLITSVYLCAMFAGGFDAAKDVIKKIPKRQFDIHFLMLAVAIGAASIGAWGEGVLLLFLFSFAEAMEHYAFHKTRSSIDALFHLAPKEATLIGEDGSESMMIRVEEIRPGQVLLVKPGDLFPVDGEVISGKTAADESNLTGESKPIEKSKGSQVYSGTINMWGAVKFVATRGARESSLQKIIKLIQQAKHLKAKSERFTENFGTYYTLSILSLTTGMFFIWWLGLGIEPFLEVNGVKSAFYRAMTLLVVASPCAIVISVPSAILAAIAWGAQHGILFRGGAAIEKLSSVDLVALDKTGTLTTGELSVEHIESFPSGKEAEVLELAYSLEKTASHPIARAIVEYAKKENVKERSVENFSSILGKGLYGEMDDAKCILGRRALLAEGDLKEWINKVEEPSPEYTEIWVVYKKLIGRILLKDQIREQSKYALEGLREENIYTLMLTGDRRSTAEDVGKRLGVEEIKSGLSPEDKVTEIRRLAKEGHKVAMVGDGVNDAPSLAAAYVSVAMGARASDAALEQSEVVLMNDRIDNFLSAYRLSKRASMIIKQNLFISMGTIAVMVTYAVLGKIPLSIGVFSHEGSTVIVCLNSLRLLISNRDK